MGSGERKPDKENKKIGQKSLSGLCETHFRFRCDGKTRKSLQDWIHVFIGRHMHTQIS